MGATCSVDTPQECGCFTDATAYQTTKFYAYCDDSVHSLNNCCSTIGDNYATFGQTYHAYNCLYPDSAAIASQSSVCEDPNSWVKPVYLSCGPVKQFFEDMGGYFDQISNGDDPNTFCCGKFNITCDSDKFVTGINWSFKNNSTRKIVVPASIGGLNGLKWLDLSGNQIYGFLPPTISNLNNLEYLNLSHNSFTGPINGIAFKDMARLKFLDISYNKFGDNVPDSLAQMTKLTDLFIQHNRFSGNLPSGLNNLTNFRSEKYNIPKANQSAVVEKRRQRYFWALEKATNIFDQVAIINDNDVFRVCPSKKFGNYLKKLYHSFLDISENATQAVHNMNSFQNSRAAGVLVQKSLIASFKLNILASSSYCSGQRFWGYNGLYGPSRWYLEYPKCGSNEQSPVNFGTADSGLIIDNTYSSVFNFSTSAMQEYSVVQFIQLSLGSEKKVVFNSHDSHEQWAHILIDGQHFSLVMTEIHTPSEHRINGNDYVAEAQFYFVEVSGPEYDDYSYYNENPWYFSANNHSFNNFSYHGNNSYYNGSMGYGNYSSSFAGGSYSDWFEYTALTTKKYFDDSAELYMNMANQYRALAMQYANSSNSSNLYLYESYMNQTNSYEAWAQDAWNYGTYYYNYYMSLRYNSGEYNGHYSYNLGNYGNYSNNPGYYGNYSNNYGNYGNYSNNYGNYGNYSNNPGYYGNYSNNYDNYGNYSYNYGMNGSSYGYSPNNQNPNCYWNGMDYVGSCKFSFRGPSDHYGENYHASRMVAIGAFISVGDESSTFLSQIANAYNASGYSTVYLNYSSAFSEIQKSNTFYSYKGSYTSPPCPKDVEWMVTTSDVFKISLNDLKKIEQIQGFNARDTQELRG